MSMAEIDPESGSRIPLPRREDLNSEVRKSLITSRRGRKGFCAGSIKADIPCEERSIAMLVARRSYLFFAHLFGPCVEPGYRPVHLPKLHIVAVDEPPGGFDGGLVINTIQLNHANGSVV